MAHPTSHIAENRRARFDYEIIDTLEAGLILTGSEVKSIRKGHVTLQESHIGVMEGDLYLFNAHIPEYLMANHFNHEPRRPRKLLLRRRQIQKWMGSIAKKGMTAIPLKMYYNKKGLVKIDIALGKGKKVHDKRETIKQREWKRDKARILKNT
jgi:SsrA-binding protein